ncbi:MAG: hypothetical protein IT326_04405 [Anaerolineae bacterium]|nr:hypothetical protein [Anaerolineae bacterium]
MNGVFNRLLRLTGVVPVLMLAVLACNAGNPAGSANATPTIERTPIPTLTSLPTTTPTLPPTETPVPTQVPPTEAPATALPASGSTTSFSAVFVSDVTVPDGTSFAPGESFNKTWRLRNNGSAAWTQGTKLTFVRGQQMGAPASVAAPATGPGSNADITVGFTAPATPGTYESVWQLRTTENQSFGAEIFVKITVAAASGGSSGGSGSGQGIDLIVSELVVGSPLPYTQEPIDVRVVVQNKGTVEAPASRVRLRITGEFGENKYDLPAIPPGETREIAVSVTFKATGEVEFLASADIDEQVSESDEANNSVAVRRTVGTATLHKEGAFSVPPGECFDFDVYGGLSGCGGSELDYEWRGDRTLRRQNTAVFTVHGFFKPGLEECRQYNLGAVDYISLSEIPNGTYVCMRTTANRTGWFRVIDNGSTLKLEFKVWNVAY